MSHPRVSVVMSVFNGETFLSEAIESILGQIFDNFEFLVIDDGSTDRTPEILSTYERQDPRVRIIRQENKGRATSLNIGINLAKTEFIARMDADDISLPHRFREQIEFLDRHPEVGLLGGAVELIKDSDHVVTTVRPTTQDSEIQSLMLQGRNPMWHPTVVMRKEIVIAVGGYRKPLLDADDYDLFLRMGECSQIANLNKFVLKYRIHPNQVSVRNMRHQVMCVFAARAAASLRRCGKPDPLWHVENVTPELLDSLGVTPEEIQRTLVDCYGYWMHLLKKVDGDSALRTIEEFVKLAGSGVGERSIVAEAWLAAAGIYYRQRRPVRALISAARALLLRPSLGIALIRAMPRLARAS
jgi:glycosyltransferase involved in cell wall biosynthesis